MDSAQGIVRLEPDEADSILALPRAEVGLLSAIASRARVEGADAARRKAAPAPTTKRTGIMHMRRAPAFTYAMQIEGAKQSAIKIGWAFDWLQRERTFNHAAMPAIGGLRYNTKLHQLFNTARDAFRMEQWLLRRFANRLHANNIEIVTPLTLTELQSAWTDYLVHADRCRRWLLQRDVEGGN